MAAMTIDSYLERNVDPSEPKASRGGLRAHLTANPIRTTQTPRVSLKHALETAFPKLSTIRPQLLFGVSGGCPRLEPDHVPERARLAMCICFLIFSRNSLRSLLFGVVRFRLAALKIFQRTKLKESNDFCCFLTATRATEAC